MWLANGLCQGQVVIRVMPDVYFSVPVNKSQSCLTLRSPASPKLKTKMLFWIQSTSLVQVLLFRTWVWNWWSLSLLMPLKLRFQRCVPWSFWVWFKDKPLKLCWSRECLYVNFPFQINPGQDLSDPSKGMCYWKTFLAASSSVFSSFKEGSWTGPFLSHHIRSSKLGYRQFVKRWRALMCWGRCVICEVSITIPHFPTSSFLL